MKFFTFFIFTLMISLKLFSQNNDVLAIENLENDKEVNDFVNSIDGFFTSDIKILSREELEEIELNVLTLANEKFSLAKLSDLLNIKNYEILDFDNDGFLDILIRGRSGGGGLLTILLLHKNGKKFDKIFLSQDEEFLIKSGKLNNKRILEYYYFDCNKNKIMSMELRKKILIFKSGILLDYNDVPSKKELIKIAYKNNGGFCLEGCPPFQIKINSKGKASYIVNGNKEESHIFKSKIEKEVYEELITMINYIDFNKVERCFKIQTPKSSELKLTYSDGSTKLISDAGNYQNFTLNHLIKLIKGLRYNQNWN